MIGLLVGLAAGSVFPDATKKVMKTTGRVCWEMGKAAFRTATDAMRAKADQSGRHREYSESSYRSDPGRPRSGSDPSFH